MKTFRLSFFILLIYFSPQKSYSQVGDYKEIYANISNSFNIKELADSTALYNLHLKVFIKNKKLSNIEVYPATYSHFFDLNLLSKQNLNLLTNKRNAILIIPMSYLYVSSKSEKLFIPIGARGSELNSFRYLFDLQSKDKSYIYLNPIIMMYDFRVYD